MRYKYKFTVFTPTYNRAHTLSRVYESLKSQTFHDFEWLIVDDGSADHTSQMVSGWELEAHFPVQYLFQANSGKHVAFNRGVQEAKGELFLAADSDDTFVPSALERFLFHWNAIPENERENFSAVTSLCKDQNSNIIGNRFPSDIFDSNTLEVTYRYKVKGEKWGFHRTDVLLKYPFPERFGQKYVPESVVWNRIARDYKTRFINEPLRTYCHDAGDQLTKARVSSRANINEYYACFIDEDIDWFRYAPLQFFKNAISYVRLSFLQGDSFAMQQARLRSSLGRMLWLFALIPGFCISRYDLWRESSLIDNEC